jgi:hypothetical protein
MKLVEIDLSKAEKHDHPEINSEDYFLAEVYSGLHFGRFTKQWYGWNFNCGWGAHGAGIQFDAPGFNASKWKRLWKIVHRIEEG